MQPWAKRFPSLFERTYVAYACADVAYASERPADELVSRLHLVARTVGGVVVCVSDLGWRFLPGGTREPGETLVELAERELMEEAGARRTGALVWLGGHRADRRLPEPFRPHLPHPTSFWSYAVTDVVVDTPPSNPPDGEQVTEVLVLPAAEAADFIAVHDSVHADVVRLADAMGLL